MQNPFLFVCFIVPLENFSLIWRPHHYRWRASNFDLCSALMAIEQWGFLSVPHLLWHGTFVYDGHLRGHVTLTHIAEHLAVELSLPIFTTYVWFEHPTFRLQGQQNLSEFYEWWQYLFIVLLAENENKMQHVLDILWKWCEKWRMWISPNPVLCNSGEASFRDQHSIFKLEISHY